MKYHRNKQTKHTYVHSIQYTPEKRNACATKLTGHWSESPKSPWEALRVAEKINPHSPHTYTRLKIATIKRKSSHIIYNT